MKGVKIIILEDNKLVQELMRDTVCVEYKNCVITDDPIYVLSSDWACGIFDYNLGLEITGQDVAEKSRRMYGSKKFLISHTSEQLTDLEKKVYDVCVQKASGLMQVYNALDVFNERYKR